MRISRVFLVLVFVIGTIVAAYGSSEQIYAVKQSDDSQQKHDLLLEKAKENGTVSIIVSMQLPASFTPEGNLPNSTTFQFHRAAIAAAQQELLSSLSEYEVDVYRRYKSVPYLAMIVDEPALQALLVLPSVALIQEDIPVFPLLASSTAVIGMPDIWNLGFEGAGQAVVILDTGIDADHPFFGNRVVAEACFSNADGSKVSLCPDGSSSQTGAGSADATITSCEDADGDNICSHGTHVAGIAAGNGSSYDGVARASDIIAIQVFTRFNDPADCDINTPPDPNSAPCIGSNSSDLMAALDYVLDTLHPHAADYNIASVNMSLGGGRHTSNCDTEMLKENIDNLILVDIATVIAAGNAGDRGAVSYPGCISTAVTIGSTTDADDISSFSNMHDMVDLLAPGSLIDSSIPGGGFESMSGTSMAAPHVSGAWAIIKGVNPSAKVEDILTILESTGVDVLDGRTFPNGTVTKPRIQLNVAITDTIEILSPSTSAPGYAGPYGNPTKLVVEVTKPEDGLLDEKFGSVIGEKPADVVTVNEESDKYILEISPPEQDANGLYNLVVSVTTSAGMATDSRSDAVSYAPTVGNNNVFFPLIVNPSPIAKENDLIGTVTASGFPAEGLTILLNRSDSTGVSNVAAAVTDSMGRYSFKKVSLPQDNSSLTVRWNNDANNDDWLSTWACWEITASTTNPDAFRCDFDIANIELLSPDHNATLTLPAAFSWEKRALATDEYEFNIADMNDFDPHWWTNPALGYVAQYNLSGLPAGFSTGDKYGWWAWVNGPDGYGLPYYYRFVTFNNTGEPFAAETTALPFSRLKSNAELLAPPRPQPSRN